MAPVPDDVWFVATSPKPCSCALVMAMSQARCMTSIPGQERPTRVPARHGDVGNGPPVATIPVVLFPFKRAESLVSNSVTIPSEAACGTPFVTSLITPCQKRESG
jgi:hypothetical protein